MRYPGECRDPHIRLLPTAGVCEQHVGATIRLLPTEGVCDQRVGASLRLLPTAGVCEQHVSTSIRLACRRVDQTFAHRRCMPAACRRVD